MKLFDDMIMLEYQKDEWEQEKNKSRIVLPDNAKERTEGKDQEMVPPHFFRVVDTGPDCKRVNVGDRIIPKPPSLQNPARFMGIKIWMNGKLETRHVIRESDVGGIE